MEEPSDSTFWYKVLAGVSFTAGVLGGLLAWVAEVNLGPYPTKLFQMAAIGGISGMAGGSFCGIFVKALVLEKATTKKSWITLVVVSALVATVIAIPIAALVVASRR